ERRIGDDRGFDQGFSIPWTQDDIRTKCRHQLSRGRLDDEQRPIENAAKRMLVRQRQIVSRVQKNVDGRREGGASAVAQHNDKLEAAAQILNRILQTAKHFPAQPISCNTDYKKIVGSLVENELHRNTGIRAAQNGGERSLLWHRAVARDKTQVTQ